MLRRFSCCGCTPLLALESRQTVLLLCRRASSALCRALCVLGGTTLYVPVMISWTKQYTVFVRSHSHRAKDVACLPRSLSLWLPRVIVPVEACVPSQAALLDTAAVARAAAAAGTSMGPAL